MDTSFKFWIPTHILLDNGHPRIRWTYIGQRRFEEPFMGDSLTMSREFSQNDTLNPRITSIETLAEVAASVNPLPLSAFIFHTSRCGSTLLAQTLAQMNENVVFSEPPVLDQALRLHLSVADLDKRTQGELIRNIVRLLCAQRNPDEKRVIIKTDCWHLFLTDRLLEIFPEAKRIFLYRKPSEIIRSHRRIRGTASVPGMVESELSGVKINPLNPGDLDGYLSRMLLAMMSRINISFNPDNDLLLSYHQGNKILIDQMLGYLRIHPSHEELDSISQRIKQHSKNGHETFDRSLDETATSVPYEYQETLTLFESLNARLMSIR